MARRTRRQSQTDDIAFPVRVKFSLPRSGLGARINDIHIWLREEVGTGRYAWHNASAVGSEAVAVYFVQIADALRFADAHADVLTLADGTLSREYYSAYKRSPLKWKEPLAMDAQMMIDATRALLDRFDRSLQNPETPHVILTRDEAVLTRGLLDGLRELWEQEMAGKNPVPVPPEANP